MVKLFTSFEFIIIPLSPTTLGSDDVFDVITGHPQDIASSGGKPKPSYNGKDKQINPRYYTV